MLTYFWINIVRYDSKIRFGKIFMFTNAIFIWSETVQTVILLNIITILKKLF